MTAAGSAALVLLALALMPVYLPLDRVVEEMTAAWQQNPGLLGLSAVIYLLSWPLRGVRYRDILAKIGFHERVGFLTGAIFISQTGNLVFPARLGDGVRAYVVKARRDIPYASGFASLAVERVFDLLTITLLAGTVLIGLVLTGNAADLQSGITSAAGLSTDRAQSGQVAVVVASAVGLAAIAAVVTIVLSARTETNYVRTVVGRLSSDSYADYVASVIERFTGDVQTVAGDGRSFARVGFTSVLIWSLDVITAVVVLAAFGVDVAPTTLLAVGFFAVSVGNLAKVLPLSPGGIGLYEGAFTLFVFVLVPAIGWEVALGAAIVDHAVKNLVTVLGGVGSMAWLNVSLTEAVEESRDAETAETAEVEPTTPD